MFCTSLRRRPSIADLIDSIASPAPNGLYLKESNLNTHDISIPLPNTPLAKNAGPPPPLLLLILTPSHTDPSHLPTTLSRIHHFTSLTGGTNSAIFFHLHPASISSSTNTPTNNPSGLQAYTTLTTHLLLSNTANTPTPPDAPPIVLVPHASTFQQMLRTYIQSLTAPLGTMYALPSNRAMHTPSGGGGGAAVAISAYDLLPYCTVNPQLHPDAVTALSDAFVDLRDLVRGAMGAVGGVQSVGVSDGSVEIEESGAWRLESCLGGDGAADVLEFWREEWVAE